MSGSVHVPVLVREVLYWMDLRPGLTVVDGTVGAGGHSREIVTRLTPDGHLIGLDRDPMMLGFARENLSDDSVKLIHSSYANLPEVLETMSLPAVDRVLLDLGLSSDQLADRARGFGFDAGGELDLRFDTSQGVSAADWLTNADQQQIETCLIEYGEERNARRIADAITKQNKRSPISTTEQLVELVEQCSGRSSKGKHPATRVFQALRIQVNAELEQLQKFLDEGLPSCLAPGGRAAIISFHSLEDRMVKTAFRNKEIWDVLTTKPVEATPAEQRINPRSRSAKLRAAVRRNDAD